MQRFGIQRSDRRWYIGTVDKRPVFGDVAASATYTEQEAERRLKGLRARPEGDHTFELIPVGGDRG